MKRKALLGAAPAALVVLASYAFVALSTASPTRLVLDQAFLPPGGAHPLGTGEGGVDLLAALGHATARGVTLALVVTIVAFAVGAPLGTWAGLRGGKTESFVVRTCDLVQSFPTFLLAVAVLSAVRAPSRVHLAFVFLVGAWAPFARLAVAQATILRSAAFIEAARALGASAGAVLFRHALPNVLGPIAVQLGSSAAAIVLGEAALGFLGIGPRDGVSLGALLEQGVLSMIRAPHVLGFGALTVALLSGSLQLASEALRARGAEE